MTHEYNVSMNQKKKRSKAVLEQNSIIYGLITNALLSITGIVYFFLTNSVSILFDSLYSGVMTVASVFAIVITAVFSNKKHKNYPLGASSYENLFTLFKTILVLAGSAVFFVEAILSLVNQETLEQLGQNPEYMISYIVIVILLSAVACFVFWYVNKFKNCKSEILRIELKSAFIDLFISVSVGVAMVVAAIGIHGNNAGLIMNIIDKSMVLVVIVLFTPTSLKILWEQIKILAGKRLLLKEEQHYKKVINNKIVDDIYIKLIGKNRIVFITIDIDKTTKQTHKSIHDIKAILKNQLNLNDDEIYIIVK